MSLADKIPDEARPFVTPGANVEDVRLGLRARVQRSTYFTAKAILRYRDIMPATHGPMAKFIDDDRYPRKLGLAPRDHLKTSIWTIANCVKRIAANPNIRILLGNETSTNASHFLRRIQAVFDRNELFRWLFPELVQTASERSVWNQTEMLVPRSEDYPESTIEVIGVGGAVVSRHYDLIKLDDLVGKEASESEEVMKKTIDWYDYCESLLDHPTKSELQNYGTRWAFHDVHSHAEKHEINPDRFYSAALIRVRADETTDPSVLVLPQQAYETTEGWRAFWPERFPVEVLLAIKKKIGSFKFSCQYQNDPRDPDKTTFRQEWLRFYSFDRNLCVPRRDCPNDKPADWRGMFRTLIVDPAISEDDLACNTAITITGVDADDRKFLLETWHGRVDPGETIQQIITLWYKWDQPEVVGIESVAYQKALKYFLEQECLRRGIYMHVVEIKRGDKKSKKARIRGLMPYFERGEIYCREDQHQFLEEYEQFPTGKLMDVLDTIADGPAFWMPPEDEGFTDEDGEALFEQRQAGRSAVTGY